MQSTKSIPPFHEIVDILTCETKAEQFLFDQGALFKKPACGVCSGPTKRKSDCWICIRKSCARAVSVYKGSFFQYSSITCSQVLHIAYLWLNKVSATAITTITGHSNLTICRYIKHLNQLAADNVDVQNCAIGGPGVIVEIDECKIAKRKYHRGHRVDGAWIVGGVERTTDRKLFAELVENRSSETLKDIIQRNVMQGSIIHTDMWRGYACIDELEMQHFQVNHSKNFKDPVSGIHTNTIEGTWSGLKRSIPVRNRNKDSIEEHILTFIWRRQNEGNLWNAFVKSLAETCYL